MRTTGWRRLTAGASTAPVIILTALIHAAPAAAQDAPKWQPVLPDLTGIVVDEEWALVLGKALFWDEQVGSDGVACATCHYQAGADVRLTNALSPGMLQLPDADMSFGAVTPEWDLGLTASGGTAGPNYTLTPGDFPFHQLEDPDDRNSAILISTNDRVSSAGAFPADYSSRMPKQTKAGQPAYDQCKVQPDSAFRVEGLVTRQVEPRHTPTTINAVFNHRNFWDGRASDVFNGVNPFGTSAWADPTVGVVVHTGQANFELERLAIPNASLASQASGPPLSAVEMSCAGREFPDLGRRMLRNTRRPLAYQDIHPKDSVFGVHGPKGDLRGPTGLSLSYQALIERAFHPKYWSGPRAGLVKREDGTVGLARGPGFNQVEHNFSMFFSVAVMLYEATLISDESRFDTARPCVDDPACDPVAEGLLTEEEVDGWELFNGGFGPNPGGRCFVCHGGPMFTAAARIDGEPFSPLDRTFQDDGHGGDVATLADEGFFNIGLRPVYEDPGVGGVDPYGTPLSLTRRHKTFRYYDKQGDYHPGFDFDPCSFDRPFSEPYNPDDCAYEPVGPDVAFEAVKVDGAMKTPGLRNVALTPPYFHYGGYSTLEQVVEFYAHGGNRRDLNLVDPYRSGDDSGTGIYGEGGVPYAGPDAWTNVDDNVLPLNLAIGGDKDQHYGIQAIVAFMKALTDRRVQCDKAPFDHHSLRIFVGHAPHDDDRDGRADDQYVTLPAVGAYGYAPSSGLCIPNGGDLFWPGMQSRVGGAPSDPADL